MSSASLDSTGFQVPQERPVLRDLKGLLVLQAMLESMVLMDLASQALPEMRLH